MLGGSSICASPPHAFTGRRAGAEKKALAGASMAAEASARVSAEPLTWLGILAPQSVMHTALQRVQPDSTTP